MNNYCTDEDWNFEKIYKQTHIRARKEKDRKAGDRPQTKIASS
jgi:hypothetical protein